MEGKEKSKKVREKDVEWMSMMEIWKKNTIWKEKRNYK